MTSASAGVELPQPACRLSRPEPDSAAFPGGATDDRVEPLLRPGHTGHRGRRRPAGGSVRRGYLALKADILPALFDTKGQPLWLGHGWPVSPTRSPNWHVAGRGARRGGAPASPNASPGLAIRDRGCVVCGAANSYCQAHHVIHSGNTAAPPTSTTSPCSAATATTDRSTNSAPTLNTRTDGPPKNPTPHLPPRTAPITSRARPRATTATPETARPEPPRPEPARPEAAKSPTVPKPTSAKPTPPKSVICTPPKSWALANIGRSAAATTRSTWEPNPPTRQPPPDLRAWPTEPPTTPSNAEQPGHQCRGGCRGSNRRQPPPMLTVPLGRGHAHSDVVML